MRLCQAWRDNGADVRLVIGRDEGVMRLAGVHVYEFLSSGRVPTARWETLWMILTLPAAIRRHAPDILFCAGNSYSIVSVAMKLILGKKCPPIVAKISNDLGRADMPFLLRWAYHRWLRLQARFIDIFVGMAEPMRDEIRAAMGIAASRVIIIEDPALTENDVARLAPAGPRKSAAGTRYLAIGRLAPQKNMSMLVEAFARVAKGDDTLTIVGEGSERGAIERLANLRGVGDRLSMPGHVQDATPWFGKSDVFALSSNYEGVPAVLIEALAAGIPIVSTDSSVSIAAMLSNGSLGQLVPPGNVDAFARALDAARTWCADPPEMQKMARRFTIESAAPRYMDAFARAQSARLATTSA